MRLGLSQRDSQAKKHASSSRVLFLISVAATFCAAFIPNTTKPCAASRLAEDNRPIVCPPQWLPVLLASHEAGSGLMVPGVVSLTEVKSSPPPSPPPPSPSPPPPSPSPQPPSPTLPPPSPPSPSPPPPSPSPPPLSPSPPPPSLPSPSLSPPPTPPPPMAYRLAPPGEARCTGTVNQIANSFMQGGVFPSFLTDTSTVPGGG
eukprot:scaffold85321_cov69-Phaeocystis_antarctica.AAC.1